MPNLRYKFYTFRPHPCDLGKFEDYLKFFLPYVKSHKDYGYVVERPDTPDRHIHAIVSGTFETGQKWITHENGKKTGLCKFKDIIIRGSSTSENGFDQRMLPDSLEDIDNVIGYIYKEPSSTRQSTFSAKRVTRCVEQYHAKRRIDAIVPVQKDWIFVTKKNAYSHLEYFIKKYGEKYDVSLHSHNLATALSKERYALVDLSTANFQTIVRQLIVANGAHETDHAALGLNRTYSANNRICGSCELELGQAAHSFDEKMCSVPELSEILLNDALKKL